MLLVILRFLIIQYTLKWLSELLLGEFIIGNHQVKGIGKSIQLNIQKM